MPDFRFSDTARGINAGLAVRRAGQLDRQSDRADRRLDLDVQRHDELSAERERQRQVQEQELARQQALDAAVRGGVQERIGANPASENVNPVISAVAGVEGGGAIANQLLQADDERRDMMQRQALQAAATGDDVTYQTLKGISGLRIPPQVEANRALRARWAEANLFAEQLYRQDPQRGAAFITAYMQQPGDPNAIVQQIGGPRTPAQQQPVNLQQVTVLDETGQPVLATFNPRTGQYTPVQGPDGSALRPGSAAQPAPNLQPINFQGPDGQTLIGLRNPQSTVVQPALTPGGQALQAPATSRSQPRQPAKLQIANALIDNGVDPSTAYQIALQPQINPDKLRADTMRAVIAAGSQQFGVNEDELMARATRLGDAVYQAALAGDPFQQLNFASNTTGVQPPAPAAGTTQPTPSELPTPPATTTGPVPRVPNQVPAPPVQQQPTLPQPQQQPFDLPPPDAGGLGGAQFRFVPGRGLVAIQ